MQMFQNINERWKNDPRPAARWINQLLNLCTSYIVTSWFAPYFPGLGSGKLRDDIEKSVEDIAYVVTVIALLCIFYKLNAPDVNPQAERRHTL